LAVAAYEYEQVEPLNVYPSLHIYPLSVASYRFAHPLGVAVEETVVVDFDVMKADCDACEEYVDVAVIVIVDDGVAVRVIVGDGVAVRVIVDDGVDVRVVVVEGV
jgi:hypothetical protein